MELEQSSEEILYEDSSVYNYIHATDNKILLYDQTNSPLIYDISTNKDYILDFNKANSFHLAGPLLIGWSSYTDDLLIYNITDEKFQNAAELGIHSGFGIIENGYVLTKQTNKREFHFDDQTYLVDFSGINIGRSIDQKINDQIYAAISQDQLTLYDWDTEKFTQYSFLEKQ